jgi:hypothetical protein
MTGRTMTQSIVSAPEKQRKPNALKTAECGPAVPGTKSRDGNQPLGPCLLHGRYEETGRLRKQVDWSEDHPGACSDTERLYDHVDAVERRRHIARIKGVTRAFFKI